MDNQEKEHQPWGGGANLMSKKMAQIFPTYVLGYDDPKANEHIPMMLEYLETEKWTPETVGEPRQTFNNKLHLCPEMSSFWKWVDTVLEDYRRTFKYAAEEFKVNLSWCNKSNSQGKHSEHMHPNSFISGIYYLSDNSSPTIFHDPRWQAKSGIVVAAYAEMCSKEFVCPSDKGTLVLFPSWLPHFTESDSNIAPGQHRFTISFNTLPYGVTNSGSLIQLEI